MKNILFLIVLAVVTVTNVACRHEVNPTFTFDNYEKDFDSKQPFSVRFSYIRIVNADRNKALKIIEESNRKAFFDFEGDMPRNMQKTFDMAAAQFRRNNNCDEQQFSHGDYELIVSSDINIYDRTLSYTINGYEYTGGAHGMSRTRGLNYSLDTGELLKLSDFFSPEQLAKLPAALIKLLGWQQGIDNADAQKLADLGYYPDDIKPTDNFRVTSTGITFIYNPYEVGCYAMGQVEIELPYAMIDQLLQ